MYLKQAELFWGLNQNFIQTVTALSRRQTYAPGTVIFDGQEPARRFYILIRGAVMCRIPGTGQTVHSCDQIGHIFGWSALAGLDRYVVTAVCSQPTDVLAIKREELERVLADDAESASIFYRRLAHLLGRRLMQVYAGDGSCV